MALNNEQRTILAAHIRGNTDPDVVAALAIRNDTEITRLYNLPSTFICWRTSVEVVEIEQNGFAWASIDEVPDTKWRIWTRLTAYGFIDFSKANVRQGLVDFAKNAANQPIAALRDSILPYTKRAATVAEEIFATGTGTDQNPGNFSNGGVSEAPDFEGTLSIEDVGRALNDNP